MKFSYQDSVGTLPAGRYYVGDLCYVIDEEWSDFCTAIFDNDNSCNQGIFTFDNGKLANFNTAYGDGQYADDIGNFSYCVDSGSIGALRFEDMTLEMKIAAEKTIQDKFGYEHTFNSDFECRNNEGLIEFDRIEIDTRLHDNDDFQW